MSDLTELGEVGDILAAEGALVGEVEVVEGLRTVGELTLEAPPYEPGASDHCWSRCEREGTPAEAGFLFPFT